MKLFFSFSQGWFQVTLDQWVHRHKSGGPQVVIMWRKLTGHLTLTFKRDVGVLQVLHTMRLPIPGHFYSCVVSKYLLRENEISFLLL